MYLEGRAAVMLRYAAVRPRYMLCVVMVTYVNTVRGVPPLAVGQNPLMLVTRCCLQSAQRAADVADVSICHHLQA
jgi:uncharacterized protein YbjT (DUF2867 family)